MQTKEKSQQKIYGFLDDLNWTGHSKFSLLLGEYWYLAVNVLTGSPKISDLIKNNFL